MKIKRKATGSVSIDGASARVGAGDVVEVPDEVGRKLCKEQPDAWEPALAVKPAKASTRR
jgi:hypothetical protein